MAENVNFYFNLGPKADADGNAAEGEGGYDDLVDMLCDMMCGGDDDCYSEEEIEDLVEKLADEFDLTKKKAKAIVDFVFEWAEEEE